MLCEGSLGWMIEEWPITAVHVANIKVLVAEFNGVFNIVFLCKFCPVPAG